MFIATLIIFSSSGETRQDLVFASNIEQVPSYKEPAINDEYDIVFAPADSEFFPEGLAVSTTRNALYVGSTPLGVVVEIDLNETPPEVRPFVGPNPEYPKFLGLLVEEKNNILWACSMDFEDPAYIPQVTGFSLNTGEKIVSHEFPEESSFCNDMALDAAANLYVVDGITGDILRIPEAKKRVMNSAEIWVAGKKEWEGKFSPLQVGFNGICIYNNHIYVGHFLQGLIYHFSLQENGEAGKPEILELARKLELSDGMQCSKDHRILITEQQGNRLAWIDVESGKVIDEPKYFDTPISVKFDGNSKDVWVLESQQDHLRGDDTTPPTEFRVVRYNLKM